jgi:formiminoglutamase
MNLPLLISVPHAGLTVPEDVKDICVLTREEIVADGDEGADEIYALESIVTSYVTTDIARAIVDVNRSEEDRGLDGIVKTNTCYGITIYREPPSEDVVEVLLERYYRPYHRRLTELAKDVKFGLDCHTMTAIGPLIAPDTGIRRPRICLSNADQTCPKALFGGLVTCFESVFGETPAVNAPFKGGYIIQTHAVELPWIQVELSRASFMSNSEKYGKVLEAIDLFCKKFL